ncbi:hypothetical protein [uncultured Cohaesibacter sp.]|uniref:capsular polysaccharide export protein, LipB/KpsS family n=1 Tax=uncultured Cohaesibacter sp. TaxID=1002546 RepID=UPI0029C88DC7|nr:hypothetical protein [uncultured Cohaesibacter sp.]
MHKELNGKVSASDIAVIIPLRVNKHNTWSLERVEHFSSQTWRQFGEIRIVDHGSDANFADSLCALCEKFGFVYQRESSELEMFSLAEARNLGAQKTKYDYILFSDVDIIVGSDFAHLITQLCDHADIVNRKYRFITSPVIYLTESASREVVEAKKVSSDDSYDDLLNGYVYDANCFASSETIEFHAPASSVQLFDRMHYLAMGGQPADVSYHGGEDFDFVLRSLIKYREFPIPPKLEVIGTNWKNRKYESARSLIQVPGLISKSLGLYVFHLHHDRIPGWNVQMPKEQKWNWLLNRIEAYKGGAYLYQALANLSSDRNVCVFVDDNTFTYQCLRELLPYLGNCAIVPTARSSNYDEFRASMVHHDAKTAILVNPYASDERMETFLKAREEFDVRVFERGALPDSWFIDGDMPWHSESYDEKNWSRSLDESERASVVSYLHQLRMGFATLEANNAPVGVKMMRDKLSLPSATKTLLIALQTPNDTSVMEHTAITKTYPEFLAMIDDLAAVAAKKGWIVMVKKHPLDSTEYSFSHCRLMKTEHNIHDLIEVSAGVLCYNSGVGLLALAHGKPVCCVGKSFYIHDGLGVYFNGNYEDALDALLSDGILDQEKLLKFFHYLLTGLYSFGKAKNKTVVKEEKTLSITESVEYYDVNLEGFSLKKEIGLQPYDKDALLFLGFSQVPDNSIKAGTCSIHLENLDADKSGTKHKLTFKIYATLYGLVLSSKDRERLFDSPKDFFAKAKHPISRFGRDVFGYSKTA